MNSHINIDIKSIHPSDSDFHFKFQLIKPKVRQINYMGDIGLLDRPVLGIVGPRKSTDYGIQVLHRLFDLAKSYNLVTVSGMAEGIDQLCHHFSIQHNIPTIAVLGGGIGAYLKRAERHMIHQIVENGGLVISEYDNNMKSTFYTFPERNRIIAGLSDALFVPEAGVKSGSLITVNDALKMQKKVFATANSIFAPTSEGINILLQEKKINAVYDMEKFLSQCFSKETLPTTNTHKQLSEQELKVLDILSEVQELSVNELIIKTGLPSGEMIGLLTMLEMEKCIYQSTPGIYKKG